MMKNKKQSHLLLGAIAGDVIGSVFEFHNIKTTDFELFSSNSRCTDDTVLTIALADSILHDKPLSRTFQEYGRTYPHSGYGGHFREWIYQENPKPYNSWGNGSAMRVSPAGFAFQTEETVLKEAKKSAEETHNHPEGIKGAQATAISIFLARMGKSKQEIKNYVEKHFHYNLSRSLDDIRPTYRFDVSCQGSVPEAIIAFLESSDYENAIRLAVSIGGDSDTIACITGGIAHAYYQNIPEIIEEQTLSRLPEEFRIIMHQFDEQFG
jgi:ADP-ribosylglycohydrolase